MTTRMSFQTVWVLATVAILGLTPPANAGTISYVQITGDADSGISADNVYTHTIDFGRGTPGALINGVQFEAYTAAANGTLNFNRESSSGNASDHAGNANYNVTGGLVALLTDMYYNGGNTPGGTTTWTLSGLTAGKTYHTRLYTRTWGAGVGNARLVTFVFDPDGAGPTSDTVDISQDNATSVGFANGTDAYYVNYEFKAVAGQDLVIHASQDNNNASWHLYGLSNQEFSSEPIAFSPDPADRATDVLRDGGLSWEPGEFAKTHDVYLGTVFEDANNASIAGPRGVLVSPGQSTDTFDPGRLEFGQTYFWRVDEVNAAPDNTVFKGDVWSFTVEPLAYPVTAITATASSSFGDSGPEKTINGSGLVDDLHGRAAPDMWISTGVPATIEYAFDRAYKLHELWIWNSNQAIEAFVGFGAKDVVIEHSPDGENWTVLEGVGPLAPGPGAEGYAHNNTIAFNGATAQHVRMTINSVQGIAPQASLSEVRFFFIPTFATRPNPDSGATNVAPDSSLSWGRDGREADHHDVYVGTDASSLSLAGSVSESNFDTLALDLQLGQSYAWRVDEVNEAMDPSTWEGAVWTFTTAESIPIDDMESYRDEEFLEIWATWIDGFGDEANNGALVGANPGIGDFSPESTTVHGDNQSLPIHYDNSAAALSEATRTFDAPMDWTKHGVQGLVLFLNRDVDNTGNGQIYVKVNDTKVVNPEDPAALPPAWDVWTQWTIDLTALGMDLTQVRSLTVGIEGAGAQGTLYVDDIQLVGDASQAGSQVLTWFEAEGADILGASWKVVADPTASGGNRIGSDDGDGDDNDTAPGAEWVASYTIDVPADGVYGLSLRAQEAGSDSFWVRIVGATSQSHEDPDQVGTGWVRFNGINAPSGWAWDQVHSNDHGDAVVSWTLPAGPLTLEIAKREDGTYLDAIALMK